MKTTRKILALLMALTLCLALTAPAFAQSTPSYTITIDNAVEGETYTAYKIFNVSYTNDASPVTTPEPENGIPGDPDPNSAHTAYAYTILDTSPWWDVVTAGADPDGASLGDSFDENGLLFTKTANANEWIVQAVTGQASGNYDAAAFAALLRDNMPKNAVAAAIVTASESNMEGTTAHPATDTYYTTGAIELDVTSSGAGYYFVDTSMGSLCSLDTTEPTATIREKNSLPTQAKTVTDALNEPYGASTSASIGDTVYFQIEVSDGIGTDGELIVHDVMSSGLTLDPESIVIEADTNYVQKEVKNKLTQETELIWVYEFEGVGSTNYTIKLKQDLIAEGDNTTQSPSDNCTFEIVFNADFIAGLGDSRHIRISYEATVNENAVIAGTGNPNTSKVEYSHQMTPESTAIVYTYAGAIYKFDGVTGAELAGATFAVTADPNETSSGGFENMTFAPPSNETENPVMTPEPKRGPLNGAISAPVPLRQISAGDANSPAVYRYDPSSNSNTIVTPASGAVVLLGFAEGTVLTLTETAAPTGYNLLAAPVTITINATHVDTVDKSYTIGTGADAVTVTFEATDYDNDHNMTASGDDAEKQIHADSIVFVQNNTGTELPSTGGIGTTIFIIAGSVLVLGAGIILVAMSVSKRRAEEE